MKTGKVYLVGAGPGDPGLITRKGLDCLAKAGAVIYDHLVDERLLDLAPQEAERIYVGKKAGHHTLPQEEINRRLVAAAREGKTVVRLKGGDPFVLGRGGEEAAALVENNIPYEVIPGITSAVAVPTYAGIPVTHRGVASSFAVTTGHEDPGKKGSSLNWAKLATGVDTLVFLMGMQNLAEISRKLIKYGRPGTTPVAVIKEGTSPAQKTVVGTLEDIVARVKGRRLGPPAIIVVGEVVSLREKLRWFDKKPLFGKRILVTRARQQASRLSRLLAERGAEPIELPAIEIRPAADNVGLYRALENLDRYRWIIFTSVNGVEAFIEALQQRNLDVRALKGVSIGAIGPATAEALKDKGIIADFTPDVYTTEGILDGLKERDISGQRFLLPRADIADEKLGDGLKRLGAAVEEVTAYTTLPARESIEKARDLLRSGQVDVITFTSSSTVTNLLAALGQESVPANGTSIASIGPRTTETAVKAGLKVDITAVEQTIPGLVDAIVEYFQREGP